MRQSSPLWLCLGLILSMLCLIASGEAGAQSALGRGIYLGGSLEAGNVWHSTEQIGLSGIKFGVSLFFAADTSLGPLYFAYGRSNGRSGALYLFLGRP